MRNVLYELAMTCKRPMRACRCSFLSLCQFLSVPGEADAASLMASADATGRMTREKIVGANPFLGDFTVADLKSWADRKMHGPGFPVDPANAN